MKLDLTSEIHRGRLFRAVEFHYRILEPFRTQRTKLIEDYAGSEYGLNSEPRKRKMLVNLMLQTAEAYTLALAGGMPQCNGLTFYQELNGFAQHFAEAANHLARLIHLDETLQAVVLDAFFGPAIVKVCLADSVEVSTQADPWMDFGYPFVGRISPANWVHDTGVRDFRMCAFYGDRYRIPFYKLKDANRFRQEVVKQLQPTSKYEQNEDDRTRAIGSGDETDHDEVVPGIDLIDLYIPELGQVCTWAIENAMVVKNTKPLAVVDWDLSERPHKMLNLGPVPDNIMPTSPGGNLKNLADLLNAMFRKLDLSARHQKDVLLYEGGAEDDVVRVKAAKHMDTVKVNRKDAMQTLSFNGPNGVMQAFGMAVMQLFDRMAGNLRVAAGLGTSAETATQELMQKGQVDRREGAMAIKVLKFTEDIFRDLGTMMFNDEALEIQSSVIKPGLEFLGRLKSDWKPGYREGKRSDYRLQIQPYSMTYQSPTQRAAQLRGMFGELMQMYPVLQQSGVTPDVREYLTTLAKYTDMPELLRIFRFDAMPGRMPSAEQNPLPAPSFGKPNGKYERVSRGSGMREDGAAQQLMQLVGSAAQEGAGGVGV